jgi:hypothetical protein
MDVREIVIALEEELDMQIPEADATLITTVYGGRGSEAARVRGGDDSAGAAVLPRCDEQAGQRLTAPSGRRAEPPPEAASAG